MRGITLFILLLLLAQPAAAYTLVMRGGRRLEIAENFRVGGAQLTYEAAPGVAVTLPLDMVDVAATERANGEPAGAFLRRAAANRDAYNRTADAQASPATRQPVRTLTNRELEHARRVRVESERAYERRRAELGLPSAEEARRRDRDEERALNERARQKAVEDADAEAHWRERAAALREEVTALDGEISYLRATLAETSDGSSSGFSSSHGRAAAALSVAGGVGPFVGGRVGLPANTPVGTAFARNPANALLYNFGGRRIGRTRAFAGVSINGGTRAVLGFGRRSGFGKFTGPFGRGRFARGFTRGNFFAPGLVGVAAPFDYSSADAVALATRLRMLEGERAGLAARWRLLEEEARRAGAPPGWLRP